MLKKIWILFVICGLSFAAAAEIYSFPVNQPRELDFLTRDEVFRVRREMIKKYPVLVRGNYQAGASSVFQQIENKKPWWGLKGLLCYGPGKLSIEGESDESRFIDNPFLLISIEEGFALPMMESKGICPLSYPEPTRISYDSDTKTFRVDYNVSAHERIIATLSRNNHIILPKMQYAFHGRNAIDLGVPYVYVAQSRNIRFLNKTNVKTAPYRFRDFIHVGSSCGYPGGCNNGSPYQAETEFKLEGYPAFVQFKLWREAPKTPNAPADLTYEIRIN